FFLFFFFQAEDGIRDRNVTGVQTCALPILRRQVIREPGRAADPGNEHGALTPGAELRQRFLDRLEDRVVPTAGAPPDLLIRRVVLGGELGVGDRRDRHRLDLTPWPRSLARSPPL